MALVDTSILGYHQPHQLQRRCEVLQAQGGAVVHCWRNLSCGVGSRAASLPKLGTDFASIDEEICVLITWPGSGLFLPTFATPRNIFALPKAPARRSRRRAFASNLYIEQQGADLADPSRVPRIECLGM